MCLLGEDVSSLVHAPASDAASLILPCPHQCLGTKWPLRCPIISSVESCTMQAFSVFSVSELQQGMDGTWLSGLECLRGREKSHRSVPQSFWER